MRKRLRWQAAGSPVGPPVRHDPPSRPAPGRDTRPQLSAAPPPPPRDARLLVPVALLLAACIPSESPTLRSGDPAPDFTATALRDGSPVSLADYRGHALLVNLWATWCHPCRAETPYLQSVYERYRDRGLRILGVSVDLRADHDAVIEFVEEFGVEYDIALDPEAESRDLFHARGLPTSVLFNRDGTVAFTWIGPIPEGDPTFIAGVEAALGR